MTFLDACCSWCCRPVVECFCAPPVESIIEERFCEHCGQPTRSATFACKICRRRGGRLNYNRRYNPPVARRMLNVPRGWPNRER